MLLQYTELLLFFMWSKGLLEPTTLIVAPSRIQQNVMTVVLPDLIVYQQTSPEANSPEPFMLVGYYL